MFRLIATALFIIQLLFVSGPETVFVPNMRQMAPFESGIPVDYYSRGCVIPLGMKVETWLTELEWPYPLEDHVWDCSLTAAYTEWVLENCGYSTSIILVVLPDMQTGHAFVVIELDGEYRFYETTARSWIEFDSNAAASFADIFSLYIWMGAMGDGAHFLHEFGWWLRSS